MSRKPAPSYAPRTTPAAKLAARVACVLADHPRAVVLRRIDGQIIVQPEGGLPLVSCEIVGTYDRTVTLGQLLEDATC